MGLGRVLASSGGIGTAVVLSGVYLYSRLQGVGDQGLAQPGQSRVRSSFAASGLARRSMRFNMRDGSRVQCRILDAGGLLSVNVDRDYDMPGVKWESLKTVVDVGAHVGSFTVWAALRAPRARILAVEPNPQSFALLEKNVRDNGLHDRVVTTNAAVGGTVRTGALELVEHPLGTRLSRNNTGTVEVRVETIPRLLASVGMDHVDFLKIDCEGMEYEVFEAMGREGLHRFDAIACEYHPDPDHEVTELVDLLQGGGFKVELPEARLGLIWAAR